MEQFINISDNVLSMTTFFNTSDDIVFAIYDIVYEFMKETLFCCVSEQSFC